MIPSALESGMCPNCGASRSGAYCSVCGQSAREYQRPIWTLTREFLKTQIDFDSRMIRTLRSLLFKPGFLTTEFARGRRADYVSPVRLYLVVSVAFFAMLSLSENVELVDFGGPSHDGVSVDKDPAFLELYEVLTPQQRTRARAILEAKGVSNAAIEKRMDAIERHAVPTTDSFDTRVQDRMLDLIENPRGVNATLVKNLPLALFFALPLYAALLKVFFPARYYAEHLVFALHVHAFLFVVGMVALRMPQNTPGQASVYVLLALGVVYYFIALKRVEAQPVLSIAWKFVGINALHAALLAAAIILTALVVLTR